MEVAISHTVSPRISDYFDCNTKNSSPSPHSLSLSPSEETRTMLMLFLTLHAGFSARADMDSILDSVKVVVSMPQLMQLIPPVCLQRGCLLPLSARTDYKGCGVLVHLTCSAGHRFVWSSSPEHLNHDRSAIHSNNLLLAASLLLSGNSFAKIQLMFKFMGLKMISRDMYYR